MKSLVKAMQNLLVHFDREYNCDRRFGHEYASGNEEVLVGFLNNVLNDYEIKAHRLEEYVSKISGSSLMILRGSGGIALDGVGVEQIAKADGIIWTPHPGDEHKANWFKQLREQKYNGLLIVRSFDFIDHPYVRDAASYANKEFEFLDVPGLCDYLKIHFNAKEHINPLDIDAILLQVASSLQNTMRRKK